MNTLKLVQPLARSGLHVSRCAPKTTRGFYSRSLVPNIWSDMDRMERQMNRLMERSFGRDWMMPSWSRPARLAMQDSDYTPIESTADGSRVYRQHYAVTGMEPENVKVSIEDRIITIKAKGETESNGSKSIREHTLSYTLPEEVDPEKVRTYLADGYLTIEAPLPPVEPKKQVHELDIERKSPAKLGSDQKQADSN